jgi:hypothetical protein
MRFGELRNEWLALPQLGIHRHSRWQLKHRLRAVICLFLYTHNFWANGVSEHTGSLAPQELQVWQTPAPTTSEGQS